MPKKEFGIDPEEAKENFPEESEDGTLSSIPTRRRPGNLLSLGIETDKGFRYLWTARVPAAIQSSSPGVLNALLITRANLECNRA